MCADIFSEIGHTCISVFVSEDVMPCEVVSSYLTSRRTCIFINMTASSSLQFDNDTFVMLVCIIISHLNKKISSGRARYLAMDIETYCQIRTLHFFLYILNVIVFSA